MQSKKLTLLLSSPTLASRFSLAVTSALLMLFITATAAHAQTFARLFSFDGTDGRSPQSPMVQGVDGNLYGTTYTGGSSVCSYGCGIVFKITPGGKETSLYQFCKTKCTDGAHPTAGLVLATNGDFYGTTYYGGAHGAGTVFKITAAGVLTTLYSFCASKNCPDGTNPYGGLVQATDGNFYGTTQYGGLHSDGTVFRITPAGGFESLHSFHYPVDGEWPYGTLIQATDGYLYGTTYFGGELKPGVAASGTVFRISLGGTLATVHPFNFNKGEGGYIQSGVIQASDGNLYGTTGSGGGNCECGTVFRVTPAGKLTTLHDFSNSDGTHPYAALMQATDGNLYGTTYGGGASIFGTLFKITTAGTFTLLHSFDDKDGSDPYDAPIQSTNGSLYGTTSLGGADLTGTIFRYSLPVSPFVEALPTVGRVGATVSILGNNLLGTTEVAFNGTPAKFTVVSGTQILATIPADATTGAVEVTTPKTTLKSNLEFRVTPQITEFAPTSGPVGTIVTITGVSLTQATKVTFGGVKSADVSIDSDTQITATVPTGAVTGKIAVFTPGGAAVSATSFDVTP